MPWTGFPGIVDDGLDQNFDFNKMPKQCPSRSQASRGQRQTPTSSQEITQSLVRSPVAFPEVEEEDPDGKLSDRARLLAQQVEQTIEIYRKFQKSFQDEVVGISAYADPSTINRVWAKKVEDNRRHRTAPGEEEGNLRYQRYKLRARLEEIGHVVTTLKNQDAFGFDSRKWYLRELKFHGDSALDLMEHSLGHPAACTLLLRQLGKLKSLVDPKSKDSEVLHRFDKRAHRNMEAGGDETEKVGMGQKDAGDDRVLRDAGWAENADEMQQT